MVTTSRQVTRVLRAFEFTGLDLLRSPEDDPLSRRRVQRSARTWQDVRIPLASAIPGEGMEHLWSPAGATGGNRWQMGDPRNRSNRPIRNRWQPTATVSERMVRRGSIAHAKAGTTDHSVLALSPRVALDVITSYRASNSSWASDQGARDASLRPRQTKGRELCLTDP